MNNDEKIKEYEAHQTPVPTYDEWEASEKYNKHLEEVIKIYERKDKQATETSIAYNELLEENAQLKELLKECQDTMNKAGYLFAKIDDVKKAKRLLKQIDEVLK